jgi:hypothetical protein
MLLLDVFHGRAHCKADHNLHILTELIILSLLDILQEHGADCKENCNLQISTELFIHPLRKDVVSPCLTSFTSSGLIATSNIVTEPSILSLLLDRLLKLCNHEKQIVRKKSLVVLDRSVTTPFFPFFISSI